MDSASNRCYYFDNISDSDSDEDNISEPETQADVNENIPESAANTESQTGHPKENHLPTPLYSEH